MDYVVILKLVFKLENVGVLVFLGLEILIPLCYDCIFSQVYA
jgi:hypothetical protein